MANPAQVLDVLRGVLLEHMDGDDLGPWYRVQSAVIMGRDSGRIITEDQIIEGSDVPGGLLLTMRDGSEYRLALTSAVPDAPPAPRPEPADDDDEHRQGEEWKE